MNQDIVPTNLNECIRVIVEDLSQEEIDGIKNPKSSSVQGHFGVGMYLRNSWSLWEADTHLVKWFKQEYGIEHADDISAIILECVWCEVRGEPWRDKEVAKQCLDHWKQMEKGEPNSTYTIKINKDGSITYE